MGGSHIDFGDTTVACEGDIDVDVAARARIGFYIAFRGLIGTSAKHVFDEFPVWFFCVFGRRCFVDRSRVRIERCAGKHIFLVLWGVDFGGVTACGETDDSCRQESAMDESHGLQFT